MRKDRTVEPGISVIVPVYNVEAYLPACLDSLLAQTYTGMEVILVDDGSTDACGTICDDYAARDARFRVIHKENGGLVSARKAGLCKARGEYATYVDGDDSIEPDLIARCMEALAHPDGTGERESGAGADLLVHGYIRDDGTEQKTSICPSASGVYRDGDLKKLRQGMLSLSGRDYFTFGVEPSVWSKVFRRGLLLPYQMAVPDDLTIGEDVAVTYPLSGECKTVLIDNDITGYRYRVTPVSMTRSLNPEYFRRISSLYRYLLHALSADTEEHWRKQLEDYRFYLILTKTEEIRYRKDMSEEEQIDYLEEAALNAGILDRMEEEAAKRFRGEALKRLIHIQNRNWKALYRSYQLEPVKDRIYTLFSR